MIDTQDPSDIKNNTISDQLPERMPRKPTMAQQSENSGADLSTSISSADETYDSQKQPEVRLSYAGTVMTPGG